MMMTFDSPPPIGELNEGSLHAALKKWYARPGDQLEVSLDGYFIDIQRSELLIEIQTGNFSQIRTKLQNLVKQHPVRLVYPIAAEKWIVRQSGSGQSAGQTRKSPKRGSYFELFAQLVSFPQLLLDNHFSLEVLLIQEDEIRHHVPGKAWRRRGWVISDRRLRTVLEKRQFESPADLRTLFPVEMPETFTTQEIAVAIERPRRLAQQAAYCLRKLGALDEVGKRGRAIEYRWHLDRD
ncbi:MAG: hypothetical protein JW862_11115 [Anaerolineales bacterium]|nr:hypothetical protein [Anaerolineales bacterium]